MMSGDLELLRRRFFPTEEDKDRNGKLLGLDRVQIQPCPHGHREGINQWTGRCVTCERLEELEKVKEQTMADRLAYLELCKKNLGAY